MHLTAQQTSALDKIGRWLRNPHASPVFNLYGYAGTGKTTIARHAAEQSGLRVAYAAPTGKAASVLRRKGCPDARTLHRWLYTPVRTPSPRLVDLMRQLQAPDLDRPTRRRLEDEYRALAAEATPLFDRTLDSPLKQFQLVIVDEGSMVTGRILDDVVATGVRVLVLADPGQLPPVQGRSPVLNTPPDAVLEEIHRTAGDNPLLRLATLVRHEDWTAVRRFPSTAGRLDILTPAETDFETHYRAADQLLVYRNSTRDTLNRRYRAKIGHDGTLVAGDRVVVLRNMYPLELYNGSLVTVTAAGPAQAGELDATLANPDAEDPYLQTVPAPVVVMGALPTAYRRAMPPGAYEDHVPVDYGYALTVHKSQGSEWRHVTIWDDHHGPAYGPWLYTALTRAQERATWIRGAT